MDVVIHATKFVTKHTRGDFLHMIRSDIENGVMNTLYIYNDNIEAQEKEHIVSSAGNACIREFNIYNPEHPKPFSAGISTGSRIRGGFKVLNDENNMYIDKAFDIIEEIICKYDIKQIFYSTDNDDGLLGMSIFKVGLDVRQYITSKMAVLSMYDIVVETKGG